MTVSVITTPDFLSPVNSEIWFRFDSASSSATNFKYRITPEYRPEPFSTTSFTSVQLYKLPPRPNTGECQYTPNEPLRALFTYQINPFNTTGWATVSNNLYEFRIKYGFEYNPQVSFTLTSNVGGNLTLSFPNSTGIKVGDIIRIDKDNKQINAYYDGTCSVLSEVGNGQIVRTSVLYGLTVSGESGDIDLVLRNSGTTSIYETYNGTRQYLERTRNFGDDFIFGTAAASDYFLTNYRPSSKTIYLDEWETASMILGTVSGYSFNLEKFDVSGSSLGATAFSLSKLNKYLRMDFGVGTYNLKTITASQSYFNNVDNYNYWVEWEEAITIGWTTISAVKKFTGTFYPSGTYNTKPYFVFSDTYRTYYLWWNSSNLWWEVSSVLGGGNSWLASNGIGVNDLPPEGSRPSVWPDGQDAPMFQLFNLTTGVRVSEIRNMKIKENCSLYETVRMMWLNRAGGWDYFSFTKDNKKTVNIERSEFTKILDYNYSVGDRGDTIYAQKGKENFLVNSDWITEDQAKWLEELFTSPEVYHLSGTNKLPIIITDTNYEVKTYLRNELFNIQINYRYSYNINLQNQ
jgi:hypothetical protein